MPILLYGATMVQVLNFAGSPASTVAEGLNVAQAFAFEHTGSFLYPVAFNELSTGWWQLAAYTQATGAFERATMSVGAGREAMVVAHVLACLLLWLLARRIELSRAGAAGAVLLYAISPIAIEYHRLVLLDNLAVPWLLAALVLATIRRMRGLAYAGALLCFAAAVTTRPTFAILLPVLGWLFWRGLTWREAPLPRFISAVVAGALGAAYLIALFRWGELLPGDDRTNIWADLSTRLYGVVDQLGDAGSLLGLDPILPALGAVAIITGLRFRWLRPFSVGVLVQIAFWLGPGEHPETYVIGILPFAALLISGVIDAAVRAGAKKQMPFLQRPVAVVAVLVLIGNASLAGWLWQPAAKEIYTAHLDRPRFATTSWINGNVRPRDKIIVDDAMWVDLVQAGVDESRLITYPKVRDWQNYQYIVAGKIREPRTLLPVLQSSQRHAEFGAAGQGQRFEVRRVMPQGPDVASRQLQADAVDRARAGMELTKNVRLHLDNEARRALREARVDPRLLSVLALLAGPHELVVDRFPAEPGEEKTSALRRSVLIAGVDGLSVSSANGLDSKGADEVMAELAVQLPKYKPASMEIRTVNGNAVLEIRYQPPSPTGMPK